MKNILEAGNNSSKNLENLICRKETNYGNSKKTHGKKSQKLWKEC